MPLLANSTEFGKSNLFTNRQLEDVGYNLVIYPVSLQRAAMGAVDRALGTIAREDSLASEVPHMQTRADLYDLVDYPAYAEFDANVFDFDVEHDDHR